MEPGVPGFRVGKPCRVDLPFNPGVVVASPANSCLTAPRAVLYADAAATGNGLKSLVIGF